MTPLSGRTALVMAAAGSSCPDAVVAFDRITQAASRRFPGVALKWAYTSAGVRRKIAGRGGAAPDPQQALEQLEAEGITGAAVLSLHLAGGREYSELAEVVEDQARRGGSLSRLTLGKPLFADESDVRRVIHAVLGGLPTIPAADEAVILVAHGSLDPAAQAILRAAVSLCRRIDLRLYPGMMLGSPSLGEVVAQCTAAAVKKAWLVPLMVAAGYSARDDLAGPGESSWRSVLERAGITCMPVIRGLGENDGVVEVWMNQAAKLLDALSG